MRIHDVLAAAQLFIIARRRAAGATGNERERELWHHVREHISFIYERGQVYRFEDYVEAQAPTPPSREGAAFKARGDTVSQKAMALLLQTLEEVSTVEEKQLVRVLIHLLHHVADSGQEGVFEASLNSRGEPPPVTASFSTLDEAKEWLTNLAEPPSRAHVLIGDEYHEVWYSREDGVRDLAREYVIEPLLDELTREGTPPAVASFDTREEAETWLMKHPSSPPLFVSIGGEHHLAVYHEKLDRHSLHPLARGLKEWAEEERRAGERQKELDTDMSNQSWRPQLTTIEDPIAEDHWSHTTSDGSTMVRKITVGRPQPLPGEEDRAWYCPLSIEGHFPGVKCVMGVGPVDALMNAMTLVRRFFEEHSDVTPRAR